MTNSSENVFNTCRSCLLLSNDTYPIFESMIEDNVSVVTLLNYFLIEIEEDNLPQAMCHSCVLKLQAAYEFFETFKKSQAILEQRFVDNQEEPLLVVNGDAKLNNISSKLHLKEVTSIEQNSSEVRNDVDIEESIIIQYGESGKESHDSDDEDYLIAKSVKLTEMYKRRKCDNTTDTDSDDNVGEVEDSGVDSSINKRQPSSTSNNKTLQKSSVKSVVCKVCSECFTDVNLYLEHHCKEFFCNICEKSFSRAELYKRHMQRHSSSSSRFACPDKKCSKTFCGKQALRSHYLTVHEEKRNYLCSLCGASFKNYDNLRYHIKKHNGPSHVCTSCGKAFMLSAHLKDHMWRHLGVKPHKCTKCDKSFLTKKLLIRHVESNCGKNKRLLGEKLVLNIESM
ncbi:hypothetical protein Zmor_015171 [Zophobas morio]|uniref:Uncharacterized protein n=1 Tax=Zophobas morio TaxID=2755281 RepID=A0AA38IM14_9CUCU|nr:hypothetical protein Zmor_015171 [Zophobas morio]